MDTTTTYREKYKFLFPHLNERAQRLVAAADAKALGQGGIAIIQVASGLSRATIQRGLKEIDQAKAAGKLWKKGQSSNQS